MAKDNKRSSDGLVQDHGYEPKERAGYQPQNSTAPIRPPKGGTGEVAPANNQKKNEQ